MGRRAWLNKVLARPERALKASQAEENSPCRLSCGRRLHTQTRTQPRPGDQALQRRSRGNAFHKAVDLRALPVASRRMASTLKSSRGAADHWSAADIHRAVHVRALSPSCPRTVVTASCSGSDGSELTQTAPLEIVPAEPQPTETKPSRQSGIRAWLHGASREIARQEVGRGVLVMWRIHEMREHEAAASCPPICSVIVWLNSMGFSGPYPAVRSSSDRSSVE
jgi:hypothetical protein